MVEKEILEILKVHTELFKEIKKAVKIHNETMQLLNERIDSIQNQINEMKKNTGNE